MIWFQNDFESLKPDSDGTIRGFKFDKAQLIMNTNESLQWVILDKGNQ